MMTNWSYESLNDKATFVVIATPTKVTMTSEHATLPNISAGTNAIIGIGVETTFDVLAVVRGDRNTKTFVLPHYKLPPPQARSSDRRITVDMGGGPGLVSFEPKDRKIYLLFLEREADGRYVAVSGQIDPFWSVMEFTGQLPNLLHSDFDPAKVGHF
jgi:hypothetical protein